jgi:hypothetical protein
MSLLDPIIQGVLTGFGSAIGSYFAFKYGIDHIERIPLVKDKVREYSGVNTKVVKEVVVKDRDENDGSKYENKVY